MKIFEIKINNETTCTVDTDNYDILFNYDNLEETNIEILDFYEYVPQHFANYVNNECTLSDLISFIAIYKNFKEDLEEYYNDITYKDEIPYLDELMDFSDPEYFFNTYFSNPYEAARATQFGKVNWFDDYIKFDGYGNLKSVPYINFDDYSDEIIEQWLKENFESEEQ